MSLQEYITEWNAVEQHFAMITGKEPRLIKWPVLARDKKFLRGKLENELLPENLTRNGTATKEVVAARRRFLKSALKELNK